MDEVWRLVVGVALVAVVASVIGGYLVLSVQAATLRHAADPPADVDDPAPVSAAYRPHPARVEPCQAETVRITISPPMPGTPWGDRSE